jgi:hypothetical protein
MENRITRLLVTLVGLALLVAWAPRPASAQAEQRCFPETGHCIAGRIREFWERNGGLPVFGLPIGPQAEEQIEGRTLQVQWFERNRLELHPESQPPYDVQIGRLGADRLAQQGRDWFTFPQSAAQEGCRFFPETGHNVCGPILAAWRASGLDLDGQRGVGEAESLALFGLPLSDAMSETLGDGRSYTVQWFERARFELHPENQPPYDVLLGLLGSELRAQPAPAPQPTPAPVSYDGSWVGATGQEREVSFEVAGNTITSISFKAKLDDCDLESTTTGRITIADGSFTVASQGELTFTLRGTFLSPTSAEGTLDIQSRFPGCGGTLSLGWRASRR